MKDYRLKKYFKVHVSAFHEGFSLTVIFEGWTMVVRITLTNLLVHEGLSSAEVRNS